MNGMYELNVLRYYGPFQFNWYFISFVNLFLIEYFSDVEFLVYDGLIQ